MNTYLVGYDLNTPGQDNADLVARLKKFPNWWHHLESTWLIWSESTASAIRDELKRFLDTNDKLLVIKVTEAERAWTSSFNDNGERWLRHDV